MEKTDFEIKFPIISAVIGIIALILQYGGEHVWFSALTHPQIRFGRTGRSNSLPGNA